MSSLIHPERRLVAEAVEAICRRSGLLPGRPRPRATARPTTPITKGLTLAPPHAFARQQSNDLI